MKNDVFDLSHTLGLTNGNGNGKGNGKCKKPKPDLPPATDGYVTLLVPRGLSLKTVRGSSLALDFLKPQEWYQGREEYESTARPGLWLFRLCPDIQFERLNDVLPFLQEKDEQLPHPAVALAAILCLLACKQDILGNRFLSTCAMKDGGILQIGCPSGKAELISFQDRYDSLSVAAAAKLVK